jgi:hypothetical protein
LKAIESNELNECSELIGYPMIAPMVRLAATCRRSAKNSATGGNT